MGLSYTNPVDYLFLQTALITKPRVIILGNSRSGQMRSDFFEAGTGVVTASGFQKIAHVQAFLDNIPADQSPKVLMLGLDQEFFNPNYDSLAPDNIDDLLAKPTPVTDALADWFDVYADYFSGKFTIGELLHPSSSAVGLLAIATNAGYRNDGSHEPGAVASLTPQNPAADDYEFRATLAFIDQGVQRFEYSNTISAGVLAELNVLLAECQARHIHVIGFVPPYAAPVYEKVASLPDKYGYLNQLDPVVGAMFEKYGFTFYDFSDPRPLGITDTEMTDGIHTTERGSLKLFIKMAETDPVLKGYANVSTLTQKLATEQGQYNL